MRQTLLEFRQKNRLFSNLGHVKAQRAKTAMHSIHKYNKYIKHLCLKSHLLLPTTLLKPKPKRAERAISVLRYLLFTPLQH